jgi:hypothetical protein
MSISIADTTIGPRVQTMGRIFVLRQHFPLFLRSKQVTCRPMDCFVISSIGRLQETHEALPYPLALLINTQCPMSEIKTCEVLPFRLKILKKPCFSSWSHHDLKKFEFF